MSANGITYQQTVNIFKQKFGGMNQLVPNPTIVNQTFPFSQGQMIGDSFVEAAQLAFESGYTFGGDAQEIVTINDAVAGAVKQSKIKSSQLVIGSTVSWGFLSRSAQGGEEAFTKGFAHVTKSNLVSHDHYLQIAKLHGRRDSLLGYVSYNAANTVYRGTTFSGSGNITLTRNDNTTIAFTAGINASEKAILLSKGYYAAGIWVGKKDAPVLEVDVNGNIVAQGKIVKTDASLGILYVDFVPVAASGATSHRLCFLGWPTDKECVGVQRILTNSGELFEISAAQYELWQGNVVDLQQKSFSIRALQQGLSYAMNQGGLSEGEELTILCNPNQFGRMISDESSLRKYDASYKPASATSSFETIEWYGPNGVNRIFGTSFCMEGEIYGILKSSWVCSGSQAPAFKVIGMDGRDIIQELPQQTGFAIRSYSDEYMFCRMPAKNIYWKNADWEAVQY